MRRAAHQLLDRPRVFEDPLALRILDDEARAAIGTDPGRFEGSRMAPYLRAFLAARSRLAEDELARAVANGVRQYVVLGAGLDTFAYRNPHPGLRVFEVDHPATQEWKRWRLAAADIAIPSSVTFAPADFEHRTVAQILEDAGFRATEPAWVSWLGVTMYLTADAVRATLRFVAGLPAASGIVFDYSLDTRLLNLPQLVVRHFAARRVRAAGEPWISAFVPQELAAELHAMGFATVTNWSDTSLNRHYFADRTDGLRVGSIAHVMVAAR